MIEILRFKKSILFLLFFIYFIVFIFGFYLRFYFHIYPNGIVIISCYSFICNKISEYVKTCFIKGCDLHIYIFVTKKFPNLLNPKTYVCWIYLFFCNPTQSVGMVEDKRYQNRILTEQFDGSIW